MAQPTQIGFENTLAIALLKTGALSESALVFEDEGRIIGRCALPLSLREYSDKMYDFQLSKKKQNIVFEGSRSEVVAYLQSSETRI